MLIWPDSQGERQSQNYQRFSRVIQRLLDRSFVKHPDCVATSCRARRSVHPFVCHALSLLLSESLCNSLFGTTSIMALWKDPLLSGQHSVRNHGLSPSGGQCRSSVHLSIHIYCEDTSHSLWHPMQLQAPSRWMAASSRDETSSQWTILLTFDPAAIQEMKLNPCIAVIMLLWAPRITISTFLFSKVQGYYSRWRKT